MELQRRGRRRASLIILLGVTGLFAAASGAAAPVRDIFTVRGVPVDAEAETASAAREFALLAGQHEAFRRLLERVTLHADYPRLPRLDEPQLTALVRGIEIEEEKRSSTRYLAKLTISFKKDRIRGLLREGALRFSETASKPILVLPVYEVAGTRVLWDDPNPWRSAWLGREKRDSLLTLLVPAGDLADIAAISPAQALAGAEDRLSAIARRYGVEDTIVARAALTFDLAAAAPRLEVSMHRYGPSGDQVVVQSFVGVSRELIDELLVRAARGITLELEEGWKRDTMLQFDREMRLSARVPLEGLGDWLEVRRRLGTVAMVLKAELLSLSRADAQVVLHYLGDPGQLSISLAQRDLELSQEGGFWTLGLRRAEIPSVPPQATSAAAE